MIADVHDRTMESGFPHLIGFPWTSADTFRRSLGVCLLDPAATDPTISIAIS